MMRQIVRLDSPQELLEASTCSSARLRLRSAGHDLGKDEDDDRGENPGDDERHRRELGTPPTKRAADADQQPPNRDPIPVLFDLSAGSAIEPRPWPSKCVRMPCRLV